MAGGCYPSFSNYWNFLKEFFLGFFVAFGRYAIYIHIIFCISEIRGRIKRHGLMPLIVYSYIGFIHTYRGLVSIGFSGGVYIYLHICILFMSVYLHISILF